MDDNERRRDVIIPTTYALLCLCVTAGGVLLALHVFFPALSQPWHLIAALILIGSPWLVWLLAYVYACAKACFSRAAAGGDRQIPSRQATRSASTSSAATERKDGGGVGKQESVASSNGSEIPLARAV
ncbi:prothymosin alpha-related family protein [Striga asiatica]|uniref:Prothymosin alpha-related family protein n=1 Tax=Striga asiatica TaxID=4170 RepID=A0A5A7RJL3_STRAF|nr:prothymosin alpha-related family protein [Striga asiatica]